MQGNIYKLKFSFVNFTKHLVNLLYKDSADLFVNYFSVISYHNNLPSKLH